MNKALVLLILSAVVLTGCNTVRGVGRDVQSVGRAMERTVD